MNNLICFCVNLQIRNLNNQLCRLPVNVMAKDKEDARTIATERAKANGQNVTDCHGVEQR